MPTTSEQALWEVYTSMGISVFVLIFLTAMIIRVFRDVYGEDAKPVSAAWLIGGLFLIHLAIISTFASGYMILDYFNRSSFSFGDAPEFRSNIISAWYFSITTITSTGYGDIHARSKLAMIFTSMEMLIGYFMTVVFFSTIASLAFRAQEARD